MASRQTFEKSSKKTLLIHFGRRSWKIDFRRRDLLIEAEGEELVNREEEEETYVLILSVETREKNAEFLIVDQIVEEIR